MKYILYKTTCLINNKTYIGIHQTNNLDDGYLGSGLAFLRALKKYGKENFKREILEFCETYAELLEKEREYVNEIWVKDKTNYNLKTGGLIVNPLAAFAPIAVPLVLHPVEVAPDGSMRK